MVTLIDWNSIFFFIAAYRIYDVPYKHFIIFIFIFITVIENFAYFMFCLRFFFCSTLYSQTFLQRMNDDWGNLNAMMMWWMTFGIFSKDSLPFFCRFATPAYLDTFLYQKTVLKTKIQQVMLPEKLQNDFAHQTLKRKTCINTNKFYIINHIKTFLKQKGNPFTCISGVFLNEYWNFNFW